MAVEVFSRSMQVGLISRLHLLGYANLAERLEVLTLLGTETQKKRIVDCYVVLELDMLNNWEEDQEFRGFLRILDEICWVRPSDHFCLVFPRSRDKHAAWWWLCGAHKAYLSFYNFARLGEYNPTIGFCLRMLEALVPEQILHLHEFDQITRRS